MEEDSDGLEVLLKLATHTLRDDEGYDTTLLGPVVSRPVGPEVALADRSTFMAKKCILSLAFAAKPAQESANRAIELAGREGRIEIFARIIN